MFENFPYTDMHQLNLDWIIKIAKDFLDQYTHIQQLITDGETAIQQLITDGETTIQNNTTEAVETIASELATSLSALNDWYTEHQGYLNQYVLDSIEELNTKAAQLLASMPGDFTDIVREIEQIEVASKKIYQIIPQTVETGVKNKYSVDNWANVNYHVSIDVQQGEKYMIAGCGVNANYPLYVIYNDSEILASDESTSFSYVNNVLITIPAEATKLVVNSQYQDQPFVRKLLNISMSEYYGIEQNAENVPLNYKNKYTKLLYSVSEGMYKLSPINSKSTGSGAGYHVLLTVNPGEKYLITTSGNANYPRWIQYDENMNPIANGGSGLVADEEMTIPASCKFVRFQNNLGPDIRIKKKLPYNMNNVIWLGDSYTQANSLGADQDKRFSTLVSNRLGLNEFNFAVGGNGLFATTSYPDNFRAQIQAAATAQTVEERTLTKYIIICGGRNDPYTSPNKTQTDFDNAVSDLFSFIYQWYPDAEIVIIPYMWDATQMSNTYYQYYLKYVNSLKKQNCRIITNAYTWLTGYFDDILVDGVHPNINGHSRLSDFVYNSIVKSDIINEDYIRIPATSEYMPNWTNLTLALVNSDLLVSNCSVNVDSQIPVDTVIFEQDYGTSKNYPCFTGFLNGIPWYITNRTTGVNYLVTIRYNETDSNHNKVQIVSNSNAPIPAGVYLVNWCMKFGIGY